MGYKIDPAIVKERFAALSDSQLLTIAQQEFQDLTPEAIVLLLNELRRRNIGADLIEELEEKMITQHNINVDKHNFELETDLIERGLTTCFKMKSNNATDYQIHEALLKMGFNSEASFYIIRSMEERAEEGIKNAHFNFLASGGVILLGLLFVYLSFKIERFEAGAFIVVIAGIARAVTSTITRNKLEKIVMVIRKERAEGS